MLFACSWAMQCIYATVCRQRVPYNSLRTRNSRKTPRSTADLASSPMCVLHTFSQTSDLKYYSNHNLNLAFPFLLRFSKETKHEAYASHADGRGKQRDHESLFTCALSRDGINAVVRHLYSLQSTNKGHEDNHKRNMGQTQLSEMV